MVKWIQCNCCTTSTKVYMFCNILCYVISDYLTDFNKRSLIWLSDELIGFEEAWKVKASKHLPGWPGGNGAYNGHVIMSSRFLPWLGEVKFCNQDILTFISYSWYWRIWWVKQGWSIGTAFNWEQTCRWKNTPRCSTTCSIIKTSETLMNSIRWSHF